jgi:hypothetical protein
MDKTTKRLLAAIALGLWANVASTWMTAPVSAQSRSYDDMLLQKIANRISDLADGMCLNKKLC